MSGVSGRRKFGLSLAFVATIMWAVLPIALVQLMKALDPITITFFRFFLAAAILTLFLSIRRRLPSISKLNHTSRMLKFLFAGTLLAANYGLFIYGLERTTSEATEVIIQLAPMLFLVAGIRIFKEQFSVFQWFGAVIFVTGLILYFMHRVEDLFVSFSDYGEGMLMVAISALFWAGYAIIQKFLMSEFSSEEILIIIYWIGAGLFLIKAEFSSLLHLNTFFWGLLVFCGLNTLIAYGSFTEALAHTEASRVSAIMALTPVITSTIVQIFPMEGVHIEPMYLLTVVGAIMVVLGSVIVAIAKK
ncbi:MAG: hypothetical protein CMK43_09125 [Porticoccaceae bacterium]|nr:hypothetical protein [Porticoccaceae bacterium]